MKKFFKSKITMGVLIGLFVGVFALITIFCVRPTAVGFTYTGDVEVKNDVVIKYTYHFNSSSKYTRIMETDVLTKEDEYWYFEHEGYIVEVGLYEDYTKEEYKEEKQRIIDSWDENSIKQNNTKINAFFIEEGQEKLLSVGSIIAVSVLGGIDLILLVLMIVSIVCVCKSIKKSKNNTEIKA